MNIKLISFIIIVVVFLANSLVFTACSTSRTGSDPIPKDPDVLHGFLDNGMEYFVRSNSNPRYKAELRLILKTGSLVEDENQSGLAHVLEHMLFKGTEKYPGPTLIKQLEAFGMEMKPDFNAYTEIDLTVYHLTVNTDDNNLDTGLDILNQMAFHAELAPEVLEIEKLVIQEEWRQYQFDTEERKEQAHRKRIFHNTEYLKHSPIGSMEMLSNITAQELHRFYKEWYRPELMAIVAVGDFNAEKTVNKIQELFGKAVNPPASEPVPVFTVPDNEEVNSDIYLDPELYSTRITIGTIFPKPVLSDWESHKTLVEYRLFTDMMTERLSLLDFTAAFGRRDLLNKDISVAMLVGETDDVPGGLAVLLEEAEQVIQHGFLPSELENAKIWYWQDFKKIWEQRANRTSKYLALEYTNAYAAGSAWPSVDWEWEAINDHLNTITMDDINEITQTFFGSTNRYVFISAPDNSNWPDFDRKEIQELINRIRSSKLPPRTEASVSANNDYTAFLPANDPEPGTIIKKEVLPGTDIVILTLSNGARVYYKVNDDGRNILYFGAVSPGGTNMLDDDVLFVHELSMNSYDKTPMDLLRINMDVDASIYLDPQREGMYGTGPADNLKAIFHYLYLQHTAEPASQKDWNKSRNDYMNSIDIYNAKPEIRFWKTLMQDIHGNPNRVYNGQPISSDMIADFSQEEAYTVYRDRFLQAGDFIYLFTGNFDPEELEQLATVWLAPLRAPSVPETWVDRNIRYIQQPVEYTANYETSPVGHIVLGWAGDWEGNQKQLYLIDTLTLALEKKLFDTIRGEFGGTYNMNVYHNTNFFPTPQYRITIRFECEPERTQELLLKVKAIAEKWKTNPPETLYLHDTAAVYKKRYEDTNNKNYWWINLMEKTALYGFPIEELIQWERTYEPVTPELFMETASRYLDEENMFTGILTPGD